MMSTLEEVLKYNAEMKEFLSEVWSFVPQGRQKQFLKDERKKALLERYGVDINDPQS